MDLPGIDAIAANAGDEGRQLRQGLWHGAGGAQGTGTNSGVHFTWSGGDLKLEGFGNGYSMPRYIAGAILMGFGAMLAGGCAVGVGMTGGSIFALTAWVALAGMWAGAGVTDRLMDRRAQLAP